MKSPKSKSVKKKQRVWSKDWILRFVSLFLAVFLWYMVGGEDKVHKNVMIPVEIINLPRDLVISNQFKKQIEVTVGGPRSLILEMSKGEITRQVDLSHATPGTNVVVNEIDSIPVPRGVIVERIQPSTIILSLDKLVQKHFSIRPITVGKVSTDYRVAEIGTDPDRISITGPSTVLKQFDVLTTKPINVKGLEKSVQQQIPLDLSPAIVDLIGETSVTAHIRLAMKTVKETVEGVPVIVKIDGIPRSVTPSTVTVTATVPRVWVKQKRDLKALFDVSVIQGNGKRRMEVKVTPKKEMIGTVTIFQVVPFFVTLNDLDQPSEEGAKE